MSGLTRMAADAANAVTLASRRATNSERDMSNSNVNVTTPRDVLGRPESVTLMRRAGNSRR